MRLYNMLVNFKYHLEAPSFAQKHSGVLALESLIPKENQGPIIRMAIEAGLLPSLLALLKFNEIDIPDEAEHNHAVESCKTAIKILSKFAVGCNRCLKSLRRSDAHLALVKLISCSIDTETLGLVCVSLGHLVIHDPQICTDVLDQNCIERLSSHIELFIEDHLLRERILFFM
jgi:hypothetical protein